MAAAGLDRETLFIISADHGGHGHNHSGKVKEDRLIPWIAWGPGIRAGHRIKSDISTVDTAATALWVLGYPAPPGNRQARAEPSRIWPSRPSSALLSRSSY